MRNFLFCTWTCICFPFSGDSCLCHGDMICQSASLTRNHLIQISDVHYNGSVGHSWYDPENWCEVADPEGSCLSESWPHLDTEQLPCELDQAVFPRSSGFHVDLESGVDIFLGKLTIRGKV